MANAESCIEGAPFDDGERSLWLTTLIWIYIIFGLFKGFNMTYVAASAQEMVSTEISDAKSVIFTACTMSSLALAAVIALIVSPMGAKVIFGPLLMTIFGLWKCRNIKIANIPKLVETHAQGWTSVSRNCLHSALAFGLLLYASYFGITTLQGT